MDNREAKFVLSAYRPGGQDAADPRFSHALEQARRDPILQRWFEDSVAFDAAITEKLRGLEPPLDLHENILAGVKVSRPARWFNPLLKWAIAAALLVAAVVGSLVLREAARPHLAGWQSQAIGVISSLVQNESRFDAESHNPAELMAWLHSSHAPAARKLPPNLEKLESLGCKIFSWNGVPVSVICFVRPDGGMIHLVTTNASPRSDLTLEVKAKFVQQGEWATATWREGDMIYMLALEGSPDELRSYLL